MRATAAPFTVGIIQDSASDDAGATVAATVERVREAAARGAQIVCLKELFNAPYFCKSQQCDRFDIAEPIPGPTTQTMQQIAQELGVVLVVPIFERQARGVYRNSAAIIDADGERAGGHERLVATGSGGKLAPRGRRVPAALLEHCNHHIPHICSRVPAPVERADRVEHDVGIVARQRELR